MTDIYYTIIHYLDETATLEEKQQLLEWLKQSDENRKEFREIRDLWLGANATLYKGANTDKALETFRSRIFSSLTEKRRRAKRNYLLPLLRIASVFLVAFGLNYLLFREANQLQPKAEIINRLITSENAKGRFVLPDSTVVWLNKNTVLEYPENFNPDCRQVKLQGEAYFEVHKNPLVPFAVKAGDISVNVTGTSFVLQNYENRKAVEAILVNGKISVGSSHIKPIELEPDQRFSFKKRSNTFLVDSVNTSNYTGWINNRLQFDNTQLSDIITQMEEWYGIDIVYSKADAQHIQMTFMVRDESIEEILKAVQLIAPVQYRWEEHVLYINPKK